MATSSVLSDVGLRRLVYPAGLSYFFLNGTPPPSHDTTSANYHVTQASFLLQLDLAVQASWAARHRSKYVDVKVLLMTWCSDDLGVEREVQGLLSVFRDLYRFDCEHWKIPDRDAGREATKKVISHMERVSSNPDNLFIFYYAGHASRNPHFPGGLPTWVANRSPDSPRFDSSCIQPHLCHVDDTSPDVLLLYDSCFPANGQGSIESGRAVIELLAACGFETRAPEVGRDSFTFCLIQELADAAGRAAGISVPELHCRQICRLQSWQPNVLLHQDNEGKTKVFLNEDGVPIFEHPVRRTPVHCQLSLNSRPRAIVLSTLPAESTTPGEFIDLNQQRDSYAGTSAASDKDASKQLHVALRVSLMEDEFNEGEFRDWLCSAPAAAKGIKILGVLPSCSTMLLIQVPVEVWDMLPPSPAITFIGWVRDSDMETTPRTPRTTKTQCPAPEGSSNNETRVTLESTDLPDPSQSSFQTILQGKGKGKDKTVGFQLDRELDERKDLLALQQQLAAIQQSIGLEPHHVSDPSNDPFGFLPWRYNHELDARADYDDSSKSVSHRSEKSSLWSGVKTLDTLSSFDGVKYPEQTLDSFQGPVAKTDVVMQGSEFGDFKSPPSAGDGFRVHSSQDFYPGSVFKHRGVELEARMRHGRPRPVHFDEQSYIVITNDDSEQACCRCVRANWKPSAIDSYALFNSKRLPNHGAVVARDEKYDPLRDEMYDPLLTDFSRFGVQPIRIRTSLQGEDFVRKSRVDYSSLRIIKHDSEVTFIGRVAKKDMKIVREAIIQRWFREERILGS